MPAKRAENEPTKKKQSQANNLIIMEQYGDLKGLVRQANQSSATKMCARDVKNRSYLKQTMKADRVPEF